MCWRKTVNLLVKRAVLVYTLQRVYQKIRNTLFVDGEQHTPRGKQSLGRGGKEKGAMSDIIIKRLHAEVIAPTDQALFLPVVD